MSHIIAGIDVHKKMLAVVAVVVADASEEELKFERRKFGARPGDLPVLAAWLAELGVQEAVMESTAQYWKPVWQALEGQCHLELGSGPETTQQGRLGRSAPHLPSGTAHSRKATAVSPHQAGL